MPDTSDELDAILELVYSAGYVQAQRHADGTGSSTITSDSLWEAKQRLTVWKNQAIRAEMLSMLQDEKTPPEFARWAEYTASSPVVREHYRNELRKELRQQVISRYGAEDGEIHE